MTRRQRRALEALVHGLQTVRQIAHGHPSANARSRQWMEDGEFRGQMRAQDELFDLWLRQRAKRLMTHVFAALRRTLRSPNAGWQAKAWAVETVLRLNARYPDLVIDIVTDRRLGTPSRTVVQLSEVPRDTRRLIRSALIEPRTHGPPAP